MLALSAFSSCRAVCIPLTSPLRSKLTATINLGIHLFNPFRFSTVLTTVVEQQRLVAPEQSEDITDHFSRYLKSAAACFKDKSNLQIIGLDESVRILRILSEHFSDVGMATEVYETILKSLIRSLMTTDDDRFTNCLVAIHREGLATVIHNQNMLSERLSRVKSAKCRIALVENGAIENEDITSYLFPVIGASVEKLHQLSDAELSTLLRVFPTDQNLIDVFESKLSPNVPSSRIVELVTRIRSGDNEAQTLARIFLTQFWRQEFDVEVLPVTHQIDIAWIGSESLTRSVVSNLVWRVKRDGEFLKNLDTLRVVRLIEVCGDADPIDTRVLMTGAAKACMRISNAGQLSELFKAMSCLSGNAWLEHAEMSEGILRNFVEFSPSKVSQQSLVELWSSFVNSVGVTDWKIVEPIAKRLTRNEDGLINTFRSIIESSKTHSRIGNIVTGRILSIAGQSEDVYKAAVAAIEESGSIPFHIKLWSLKPIQVIDLLERLKEVENDGKSVLHALESLSEVANISFSTISEKMEMLFLFVSVFRFPASTLIESIADEISNLSISQFFEFIHLCALARCSFPRHKLVEYLRLVDLRTQAEPVQVADLVEDLSSLGILTAEGVAARLVTSFTSNAGLEICDTRNRAELSGRFLSSLLISLIVPSEKHLGVLCDYIRGHEIGDFDKTVIAEFACKVDNGQLRELVNMWSVDIQLRDESSVKPTETMFSPCEELSQLKKFKLFVNNQSNANLVSWASSM